MDDEPCCPEFDREMTTTRKVLERVPNESLAWKPHAKSFSLGELASHVAALPTFADRNPQQIRVRHRKPSTTRRPAVEDGCARCVRREHWSCTCCPGWQERRRSHGDLDAEAERDAALLDAEGRGATFVGPEPSDSPSRPVVGVSPAA